MDGKYQRISKTIKIVAKTNNIRLTLENFNLKVLLLTL